MPLLEGKGTSQLEKYMKLAASPSHVSSSRWIYTGLSSLMDMHGVECLLLLFFLPPPHLGSGPKDETWRRGGYQVRTVSWFASCIAVAYIVAARSCCASGHAGFGLSLLTNMQFKLLTHLYSLQSRIRALPHPGGLYWQHLSHISLSCTAKVTWLSTTLAFQSSWI